jgi:excisionase family DNA binding protein
MLTTGQVAQMAGCDRSTVDRHIYAGTLTATRTGRLWIITEAEAARWAAAYRPYSRKPADPQERGK